MQFKPPSQPGWGQPEPEPNQQEQFPGWQQQSSMYTPILAQQQQQTGYPQWQEQQPYYPPQPPYYPSQQPQYPPQQQPWPQPPMMPMQPQYPPKKKTSRMIGIGCGALVALVILIAIIAAATNQGNGSTSITPDGTQSTPATDQSTSVPTTQPTVVTPAPTVSPAELEVVYKASTTDTTIATLDKDGNADSGKDVHFTATILNFVKDSSGNTAGANVNDPSTTGVIQIAFPTGTDLSQLNVGDVLEIWGTDGGTASGQNAFGATIQEVVLSALYLTDKTTGYQTH